MTCPKIIDLATLSNLNSMNGAKELLRNKKGIFLGIP
jgi:hypothetical protein